MLHLPKTAYVLLWFPLSSETFIFREVVTLRQLGMPIDVYTLYAPKLTHCSPEMLEASSGVQHLGVRALPAMASALRYWLRRDADSTNELMRDVLSRRWSCMEVAGESWWAFFAGFHLARLLERDGIDHIHAPWANGPATAAWVASRLTGIPFSLAGRAGDIYPPDGALGDKIRDSLFTRTNNQANVGYLQSQSPISANKVHLVYNSLTLRQNGQSAVNMQPPYRLLAVGRFARTKGFGVLLEAARILKEQGFPFKLTLVGSGLQGPRLRWMRRRFGLTGMVDMPGFVSHDHLAEMLDSHDMMVVPSVVHASGDRDGIPNVIMEALSHRLPVVATDVCGIPEVIRHGETGLIVAQQDPAALAQAIQAMAADRDHARAMADAGRTLVTGMFDPDTNGRRLFKLFTRHLVLPPLAQQLEKP